MTANINAACYLYDVTRLIQRRRAIIPTGIDRIDAHWALATFEAFGDDCMPIMLHGRNAIILQKERTLIVSLIKDLVRCWFEDGKPDEHIALQLDRTGLCANAGYGSRKVEQEVFRNGTLTKRFTRAELPKILYGLRKVSLTQNGIDFKTAKKRRKTIYVNASHMGVLQEPSALEAILDGQEVHVAAYIHDLIPIEFPEYSAEGSKERLSAFISEIEKYHAHYSVNSLATANSLEYYLIRKSKTKHATPKVLYPGLTTQTRSTDFANCHDECKGNHFITLGTIEPRKNHLLLLHIWRQLLEEGFAPMPKLTIVGRRGWGASSAAALLDRCKAIQPYVDEINNATDDEMLKELKSSRGLLFPSFAEGFGLPLMEAAELNVPVIASDLPVFRELVHSGATFINPLDASSWKIAIKKAVLQTDKPAIPSLNEDLGNWKTQRHKFSNYLCSIASQETR